MKYTKQFKGICALCMLFALFCSETFAQDTRYTPNTVISDGKNGRVWNQWRQGISNETIKGITVSAMKVSGGNDTFVNIRFGDGPALDGGKQLFLKNTSIQTLSWSLGNQRANGQELVVNAYNGEVRLISVRIDYQSQNNVVHSGTVPNHGSASIPVQAVNPNSGTSASEQLALRNCRRTLIRRPRIEVGKFKADGSLFSGQYKVGGSVSGRCIEEAGYFENGRLKNEFRFPLTDRQKRVGFDIKARSGRRGELRIVTIDGKEDSVLIEELIKERDANSPF